MELKDAYNDFYKVQFKIFKAFNNVVPLFDVRRGVLYKLYEREWAGQEEAPFNGVLVECLTRVRKDSKSITLSFYTTNNLNRADFSSIVDTKTYGDGWVLVE